MGSHHSRSKKNVLRRSHTMAGSLAKLDKPKSFVERSAHSTGSLSLNVSSSFLTTPSSPTDSVMSTSSLDDGHMVVGEPSPKRSSAQPVENDLGSSIDDLALSEITSSSSQSLTSFSKRQRPSTLHNSCWTLYVDSTVIKPDVETTLRCVAHVVIREIEKNLRLGRTDTVALLEETGEITMPTVDEIFIFLQRLFSAIQLSADSAIIMLVYVHRMLHTAQIAIQPSNWKRIVLGGLLMASKVWDDLAVWNVDFCSILPSIGISEMNQLERFYLMAMEFNVNVKVSLFTKCYFVLRELAQETKAVFSLEPLSVQDARRLQTHMRAFALDVRSKYNDDGAEQIMDTDEGRFPLRRRSKSDDDVRVPPRRPSSAHIF